MAKQKRPFQAQIEAKATVLAVDEASARKEIEGSLAAGCTWGPDVEGTGAVWTYVATPEATSDVEAPDNGALLAAGQDPGGPCFWTIRLYPTEAMPFTICRSKQWLGPRVGW